jgi:hypothetical protein
VRRSSGSRGCCGGGGEVGEDLGGGVELLIMVLGVGRFGDGGGKGSLREGYGCGGEAWLLVAFRRGGF